MNIKFLSKCILVNNDINKKKVLESMDYAMPKIPA